MFLILTFGSTYVVMFQNVSAAEDEIISHTIEINNNTSNGPILSNNDNFGSSVANIGDLNNDGTSDIAVGATTANNNRGSIYIMFMNHNGTVSRTIEINDSTANGPTLNINDGFGSSVANIGDLNNDGTSDIAVGAWGDDASDVSSGTIHIMFMNSNGTVSNTIEINGNTANGPTVHIGDFFGSSVANIGDLNNDGTSDIAVGAFSANTDGSDIGTIHIMFMNSNGTVSDTIEINGNTANGPNLNNHDAFGSSVANIGDLNGDGISDIAVGAIGDDANDLSSGTIHIMFMNSNGTVSDTIEINGNTANGPTLNSYDAFGSSVANIGDLNNDGTSDIVVGARSDDAGGEHRGAAHIILLNHDGTVFHTIEINDNTANGPILYNSNSFGSSIANIGDLNNDGAIDIAVGAPVDTTGVTHVMFMNYSSLISSTITNITSDTTIGTLKVDDTITFTLTTNSTDNDTAINGAYNSIPLFWNSTDNGATYTAIYTVSEGDADQITPLQITDVIIITSSGIPSLPFDGTDVLATIDANSPKFALAETISTSQIEIVLDQNVTNNTASPNDFTLGGVPNGLIASIVYITDSAIGLDVTGATISDTDSVSISYNRTSGSFDDVSGNSLLNFTENVTNTLDTTPPVITLNGDNPQTLEFGDGYTELNATTDDGSSVTINATAFTDEIGTYSIYYDSMDASGNNATQVIRIVNVVDTTPPVITLNGDNPQTLEFGDGYTELNATTDDGSSVTINATAFTDEIGTYSIYYDSMDASGNNATQVIRIVNVVDTTPPVITLNGDNPQTIEFGDGYTELNATTDDGSSVTINATAFTDEIGTYSIYYDSMDASGNNATQVIRIVNVVDTTPPVITLNGDNPQTIEFGDGYTELNATTDDGSSVTINATAFTDEIGTYSIYYDSTDAFNNNATQVIRTVNVVDTTPPVITLNGDNPQTIEFGDGYTELNATTDDGSSVTINATAFTDEIGTYSIYYDSMDASGNNATQVIRIVNVVDTTPPVITLNGDNPQTIEFGDGYTELNATTDDGSSVTINATAFTDEIGTYSIYYDSTDAFNNNATQVIRTVNVVDTISPTFSSATLDEGTGNLTITFNERVDVHAINFPGLSIRDGPGTDIEAPSIVTPSITELVTTINDLTISFNMTLHNRQSLIAFSSYVLDIDAGTVYDLSGNAIIASSDNPITVIPDTVPPILSFTSITPNNGTQSIGDDIVIQITTDTYEAGLTLLNAIINNATPTFSEWVLPSGPDYNYRKTITINNAMVSGSADHTNFPLLVSIQNDPSLNSVAVQASGQDIRFTTIDDTLIDYEITSFSNNHTSGSLSAWVKIPTLSASTDTQIHMYYSNPVMVDGQNTTAVWDSDYVGVWHYDGDILDSTGNNNDGTNYDSIETTGIIGGGRSFDGNDYISYDDSIFPSGSSPRTLSAWVNHSNLLTTLQSPLVYGTGDTGQAYGLFQKDSKLIVGGYSDDIILNTTPTINNWYHLAMTYDGTTVRAYVDGSLDISAAKSWNTVLDEFRVGQQLNTTDQFFAGQIDEIRISDTVKTADWIKTEYDSQNSDSFYSVSVQQELVTPVYYNLTYNVAEGDSDIDDTTEGITYSITLSDAAGNPSVPLTATLPSISSPGVDANSPVITLNGTNPQIIELGDGYTELNATTDDGSSVTINATAFTDEIGTYSIYYDSMDASGNDATQVNRTVNVIDTTPPTITLIGDNPQIIEFGDGYTELNATTDDGSSVTINATAFTDEIGTYSIYYDSTDAFNNNATQVIRTVNVVDTIPPVITLNGTNPQTIEFGDGYTELGATTSDGSQVTINTDEFIDVMGTYSIYYDSTDAFNNNATQVIRTVNVVDTIPPVITLNGTNPQTIEFGDGYTELGATTSDGSPVSINTDEFIDVIGTYSIYYDSTDTAGNNAIQVNRTVNVVDTTPPVITLNGTNPQTIEFGDGYTELGATTNDGSQVTIDTANFTDSVGTYYIYYDSMDAFNNNATQVNRTVNVIDTTPPTITLIGDNPQIIELGDGYTEFNATTDDDSPVTIDTANFTDSVGTYSIYYDSTDTAGNNATQVNRTVNVIDTTPPTITLIGDNPQTIEFGDGYTELGATTNDGSQVTIDTANFTDSVGTYYIYYDSMDAFNNNATQVNRTVNVVDTIPPVITLNGTNPQTIEFGDGYTELGATTNDGSQVTIDTANFTDSVGTYYIYYDSMDAFNNNATQVNRTVNVIDTTPPTITLIGDNPQIIELGDGYTEFNATTDDGSPVTIDTANFTDSVGTYSIYYDSTDTAGNNAIQVNRTVNVVDTTPPVITLNGTNPQTIEFGDGYTELGATTNDGSQVTIDTANFTDSVGTYSIYYDSMDAFNNNATQVNRTVNVVDTIPPVITLNGTNPQTIEFGDGYTELGATTNDGSQVIINTTNFTDEIGTYSIYYDSMDASGNDATQVIRTVNVVDITSPVITLNGTNPQIIELGDGYTELGATTNDGSQVTIDTANFTDEIGTYSIYYDSTDTAGNNATQVIRTVNVVDTTPPIIILSGPNPQTIEFGDGYTEFNATTDDGSSVTINATAFTDEIGTYSIYYDSMDASGNDAIQVIRTVNVVDTTPPIITLIGDNPQIIELGDGYTELGATTDDGSPVTINSNKFIDEVCSYSIYYSSTDTSGNDAFQRVRTVNVVDSTPPPSCIIPGSGNWTINENCMVDSDVTAPGNVLVQNQSTLTVPSGITLDIDFTEFNLTVQYCSGVSVKSGGTIT